MAEAKTLTPVGKSRFILFVVTIQRHTDVRIELIGGCPAYGHGQGKSGKWCKTFKHSNSGEKTTRRANGSRRALLKSEQVGKIVVIRDRGRDLHHRDRGHAPLQQGPAKQGRKH